MRPSALAWLDEPHRATGAARRGRSSPSVDESTRINARALPKARFFPAARTGLLPKGGIMTNHDRGLPPRLHGDVAETALAMGPDGAPLLHQRPSLTAANRRSGG